MLFTLIFLAALIPILMIGAMLIDLLFAQAPRRGKWPYPDVRMVSSRLRRLENRRRVAAAAMQRSATATKERLRSGGDGPGDT